MKVEELKVEENRLREEREQKIEQLEKKGWIEKNETFLRLCRMIGEYGVTVEELIGGE